MNRTSLPGRFLLHFRSKYASRDQYGEGKKAQAIRCYQAQFLDDDMEMLLQVLEAKESIYARSQGLELAEAFKVMAPIALHCGL